MAGSTSLQCDWFVNDFVTATFFIMVFFLIPATFGGIPAFINFAWWKYFPKRIPSVAPHPIVFWLVYPLTYLATGAAYWITWFYGVPVGGYCDNWIPLAALLFTMIPYTLWPWAAFVFSSVWGFWATFAIHIVAIISLVVSLTLNIIFFSDFVLTMCIVHAVIILWFIYMTFVWFRFATCPSTKKAFAGFIGIVSQLGKSLDCPPESFQSGLYVGADIDFGLASRFIDNQKVQ